MKNILVTGASSGLGLFLSKYANEIGYDLLTVGKDKKKVSKLKSQLDDKNKKMYNKFIKEKSPTQKISTANDLLGLFKLLISDEGNILSGSAITADYSETNSFRI
jgi:NADP-dependent 3-hydroxy acid dehydrogenase YdfG